jgi:peptidoglycan/LPS O-acetylase OafA/YrhL
VHELILRIGNTYLAHHLAGTGARTGLALLEYGAAILIAYLLFKLVEEPWERRIRRGGTATGRV